MGLVHPPWISDEWFKKCPFNYCDHFGNRERLSLVCKLCAESDFLLDVENFSYIQKIVDPEIAKRRYEKSEKIWAKVIKQKTIEDFLDEPLIREYSTYALSRYYTALIGFLIKTFSVVPKGVDTDLMEKALDAFAHSKHFIPAKIYRAYTSQAYEKDKTDGIFDHKTSALFAHMAAERNARAFLALANHDPLSSVRDRCLRLYKLSLTVCEVIEREFSLGRLRYKEFGCEDYDQCFEKYASFKTRTETLDNSKF